MNRGLVTVPPGIKLIQDGTLFVVDDITPLGISYPSDLVSILQQNNAPCTLLSAEALAKELVTILPVPEDLLVLDGGGILSYLFLKRAGYQGSMQGKIKVQREYLAGKPVCTLVEAPSRLSGMLLDDIVASGQTITTVLQDYPQSHTTLACLLASANVPKGTQGYRYRNQATLPRVDSFFCAQFVNGCIDQNQCNRKPAILSLRYLITKAVDNGNYKESYLAKKFGGLKNALEIEQLVRSIKREPLDLLRRDSRAFLQNYGVI